MMKVAIIVLTDSDSPEGRGRLVHAMTAAKELFEAGHEVKILFEGAGVNWFAVFHKNEYFMQRYGPTFEGIKSLIFGACNFCAIERFGVGEAVSALGIDLLGDDGQHFSVGNLVTEGFQIITY